VVLNLIYYSCPMLCNLILNGQTNTLRELAWTPGNEFEVVTVSIDPAETFDLARKKKAGYLANLERPAPGWHFMTGYQGNVKKLAGQVGFNYRWDEPTKQFVHAAAIMVLTPDGRVSRYLYGAQYKARDMRMALTEASEGKLGTTVDKFLLFCFHYDAEARSYVPFARNFMKVGGGLIVFVMALFLLRLWRREILNGSGRMVTAK
jgi:protein SCO1